MIFYTFVAGKLTPRKHADKPWEKHSQNYLVVNKEISRQAKTSEQQLSHFRRNVLLCSPEFYEMKMKDTQVCVK